MSTLSTTVNQITSAEVEYWPSVLAGVQIAEASLAEAAGKDKLQAVANGVIATASTLMQTPGVPPTVGGIAALASLTVSILNALGVFRKKSQPAVASAPGA